MTGVGGWEENRQRQQQEQQRNGGGGKDWVEKRVSRPELLIEGVRSFGRNDGVRERTNNGNGNGKSEGDEGFLRDGKQGAGNGKPGRMRLEF